MGYKFQFVTLAGFHSLNHAMFELSAGYAKRGMAAYSELQQLEFASESKGYTCSKHQREVRTVLVLFANVADNGVCASQIRENTMALGVPASTMMDFVGRMLINLCCLVTMLVTTSVRNAVLCPH